ncbi:Cysteine-rich secretory protein family [Phytophthora infestans]|uniref:Cysteine-rich secretory protein family n=1 Tax=Phytophthora infestans TaxID=4787 RepID=A0A833THP6_PHYIN|nr:Cysteine-rich secretory protein family [Phytophthora infestans]
MPTVPRDSIVLLVFLAFTLLDYSTLASALPTTTVGSAVATEITNSTVTRELQTYSSTGFQTLLLKAVNKQRTAKGLSKLCMNKKLQTAAQRHSNDMAANNYMSHTGSDGSTMSQRITTAGYKWSACAENVAAGQTTVDAVMTAWMASSGHRANILGTKYTMFGCGYAYKSGTTYKHHWTQNFATGSKESCS